MQNTQPTPVGGMGEVYRTTQQIPVGGIAEVYRIHSKFLWGGSCEDRVSKDAEESEERPSFL